MAGADNANATFDVGQDAVMRFVIPGDVHLYSFEYSVRPFNSANRVLTVTSGFSTAYDGVNTTVLVPVTAAQLAIPARIYRHALWRAESGNTYGLAKGLLKGQTTSHA
jgi:hypothetical protein